MPLKQHSPARCCCENFECSACAALFDGPPASAYFELEVEEENIEWSSGVSFPDGDVSLLTGTKLVNSDLRQPQHNHDPYRLGETCQAAQRNIWLPNDIPPFIVTFHSPVDIRRTQARWVVQVRTDLDPTEIRVMLGWAPDYVGFGGVLQQEYLGWLYHADGNTCNELRSNSVVTFQDTIYRTNGGQEQSPAVIGDPFNTDLFAHWRIADLTAPTWNLRNF